MRGVSFFADGQRLLCASSDKSWALVDAQGHILQRCPEAHAQAINKVCVLDEHLFATGDDAGHVALWDARTSASSARAAVMTWDAQEDYISAMCYDVERHCLLSTGGDATLGVYDVRKQQRFYRSDDQEAELTSLAIVSPKRVLCGAENGAILAFKWGDWGDCADRLV